MTNGETGTFQIERLMPAFEPLRIDVEDEVIRIGPKALGRLDASILEPVDRPSQRASWRSPEEMAQIHPDELVALMSEYFEKADPKLRVKGESDDMLNHRAGMREDLLAHIGHYSGRAADPEVAVILGALNHSQRLRDDPVEYPPTTVTSYAHQEELLEAFNRRLAETNVHLWGTFQSEADLSVSAIQLMGLQVVVEDEKVFVEPVFRNSAGELGTIPEGYFLTTQRLHRTQFDYVDVRSN